MTSGREDLVGWVTSSNAKAWDDGTLSMPIKSKDDTQLIATMAEELCGSIDPCPHHLELAKRYVNLVKQHYNIKE